MSDKTSKMSSKLNIDGSVSVTTKNGVVYNFREPQGKDLALIERFMDSEAEPTNTEKMAYLAEILCTSEPKLTKDSALNLPIGLFQFIGKQLNDFFRTDDQ